MQITRRIVAERDNGEAFRAIAEGLMADSVPTARRKTRWATIKAVVTSDNAPTGGVPVDRYRRHPQAAVMLQIPGNGRWPVVKPLSAWSYGALTWTTLISTTGYLSHSAVLVS